MSFDIFLQPSSTAPGASDFVEQFDKALARLGASRVGETLVRCADGAEVEIFGVGAGNGPGGMFAVRELSLSVVGAIYRTADATSCFILPVWEDSVALRTPSNVGDPPEGGFPAVEGVESEQDLMKRLNTAFGGWSVYRGQVVGKGETKGERVSLFERMFGRKDRKSK